MSHGIPLDMEGEMTSKGNRREMSAHWWLHLAIKRALELAGLLWCGLRLLETVQLVKGRDSAATTSRPGGHNDG